MLKTHKYLLHHFATTFLSIFGTLFFIVSITFFIKMARVTAIVEVSFGELGKLYSFVLPQIFLFTLPLSFFIGLSLSLFRLSKENETIVLFSIGYSPFKLAKFFSILAFLLSVVLLLNSLVLMPISDQLSKNFLDFKKNEAKLNLKAGESGQKFSNWIILANSSEDLNKTKIYKNIVMYQILSQDKQRFVLANTARINHKNSQLELVLNSGYAYSIEQEQIHESKYNNMLINSKNNSNISPVDSIVKYWSQIFTNEKRAKNFSLYVLISLFPISSVLFAISFGIVTYRYQKNEIYAYLFSVIFAYFAFGIVLSRYYPLFAIAFILCLFLAFSFKIFRSKILNYY